MDYVSPLRDDIVNKIEQELNPPQKKAVYHSNGAMLVLAGAGSGKTRVIAYRIAYLIAVKGYNPWNILSVTFTNKAAKEMKERVAGLLSHQLRGMWIGTFHSICARILRQHGNAISIDNSFTIYDRSDQKSAVSQAIDDCHFDRKIIKPDVALNLISKAKSRFEWPENFASNANNPFETKIGKVYQRYQEILRANKALDFDSLLMETTRLLIEKKEIAEIYQSRFQQILVDEYQDTNHPQYLLLREFARKHKNICVVGDEDQSIYHWRGATIRNILEFERDYPEIAMIKLEENYRSTKTILKAASELIKKNKIRRMKTLWTQGEEGDKLSILGVPDEISEAQWIGEEIQKIHREKQVPFKNFAVFYRVNAQSRIFEEECIRRQIPYTLVGATAFYERKEIKDIIAYARLLVNPADRVAFERCVNVPSRKLGKISVQKMISFAMRMQMPILEAAQSAHEYLHQSDLKMQTAEAFAKFASLFEHWRKQARDISLAQLLENIAHQSGYWQKLEEDKDPQSQTRLENIEELFAAAEQFEHELEEPLSKPLDAMTKLESFLENKSLSSDVDRSDISGETVVLMTLHSAKGLEFPYVFMAGMEEGLFPHQQSMDDPEKLEEERRLCYVGITRAKKKVYLTFATSRRLYNRSEYTMPSRFLDEIPDQYVETLEWRGRDQISSTSIWQDYPISEQEPKNEVFSCGDMVTHRSFGLGVVLSVEGEGAKSRIMVDFQQVGKKTLIQEYARLTRV